MQASGQKGTLLKSTQNPHPTSSRHDVVALQAPFLDFKFSGANAMLAPDIFMPRSGF